MTSYSPRAMVYGLTTALLALCSFLFGLSLAEALFGPLTFGTAVAIGYPISGACFRLNRRLINWAVAR